MSRPALLSPLVTPLLLDIHREIDNSVDKTFCVIEKMNYYYGTRDRTSTRFLYIILNTIKL